MDFDQVRGTVDEVITAMWATDPDARLFVREWWPGASCEHVAVAIAAVLEDRGLGRWTFVVAARPQEINGHAWLEWRGDDGQVEFSIDRTLHQFEEWDAPFVDVGPSPATNVFTDRRWEGPIWEWPFLGNEGQIFQRLIRAVRDQLLNS